MYQPPLPCVAYASAFGDVAGRIDPTRENSWKTLDFSSSTQWLRPPSELFHPVLFHIPEVPAPLPFGWRCTGRPRQLTSADVATAVR
jgi:hypothetical protein